MWKSIIPVVLGVWLTAVLMFAGTMARTIFNVSSDTNVIRVRMENYAESLNHSTSDLEVRVRKLEDTHAKN
jgi:hypothetical protein